MSTLPPRSLSFYTSASEFSLDNNSTESVVDDDQHENEANNSQTNLKPSAARKHSAKKSVNGLGSIFKIPKALLVTPIPSSLPPSRSHSAVGDFINTNKNASAPRAPPPTPSRSSVHTQMLDSQCTNPLPLSTPTTHLRSASMDNSPRSSNVQDRNILSDMSNQQKLFALEGQEEEQEENENNDNKQNSMQIMLFPEGTEQMGDVLTLNRRYSQ